MLLKHYFTDKIAHSSYILAGRESCAVIDPRRDVDIYINEARALGVVITHVLQTHLHADFVSGHLELAAKTGAKIYVAKSAHCAFDHIALAEGDEIGIEDMVLRVLETPGHTPEHLSYIVIDKSRAADPIGVFVGDTLFVGDVGRPDLFPDIAEELAGELYQSLHDKLLKLPDYVEIYPAHGAGSLCGRSMSAKWLSTIGFERKFNSALQIKNKADFIKSLTTDMPPAPDHFSRCSGINRNGPAMLDKLHPLEELDVDQFAERMKDPGSILLDTRGYHAFAAQHIPGAWHLDLGGNFPTFAGWVLPTDKNILVIADDYQKVREACIWSRRAGVDKIAGYLSGGMTAWAMAGFKTGRIDLISPAELHEMICSAADFVLLDVRAPLEYQDNHIETAVNIPVAEIRTRYRELDREKTTVVICSTGNRASLGISILKQHGFSKICNVAGGMTGYSAAGYSGECRICAGPHVARLFASSMYQ